MVHGIVHYGIVQYNRKLDVGRRTGDKSLERSITTGGQDGAAMATPDGTRGDRQARQVRLLLLLFFFLLSSFLLLTFIITFDEN